MNTIVRRPFAFRPVISTMNDLFGGIGDLSARAFENITQPWRVDEKDGVTTLSADLAGFSKDQIEIQVDEDDRRLTIRAEAKQDEKADESESVRHGFYNRKVRLDFALNEAVDIDSIESAYKDGVLAISFKNIIPVKAEPRRITVK